MKTLKIITITAVVVSLIALFFALRISVNTKQDIAVVEEIISAETSAPSVEEDHAVQSANICYSYLSDDMFAPNAESGVVQTCEYTYNDNVKKMQVYLPYGYDSSCQYNVLVLLHGSKGDEGYWFGQYQFYDKEPVELKNLIDNMIYWGYCEPLIIVSPTYYLNDEQRNGGDVPERDFSQFSRELHNCIIPYIKENYSTYEDRNHFGFIGASYGSMILYNSILPRDFDLFSWWGAISGYDADIYLINMSLDDYPDDMDIGYFYTSAGSRDSMKRDTILGYNNMQYMCPKIDGSNICYTEIIDADHNGRVWVNGIYNCLLTFFNNNIEVIR